MSRVNYGAKPIMLPQPVLIIGTYDENGVPNAMNAAWGITTDFKEITISLSEHKTTDNFKITKAFTVSMATEEFVVACVTLTFTILLILASFVSACKFCI